MSIPKIIHYCWFGSNPYPEEVQRSLDSWAIHLGDYKIMKWDEGNSDMNFPFVKSAYQKKLWAFVSDYIRLKALYDYGGVYLDTDMFAVKSINDLLEHSCFLGAESSSRISCGIIAVEKEHPFIAKVLEKYNDLVIPPHYEIWRIAIPIILTNTFRDLYDYTGAFENKVVIDEIVIYPKSYFYPLPNDMHADQDIYKYIDKTTYMVHLWSKSWKEVTEFTLIKRTHYFLAFKKAVKMIVKHRIISMAYYKKIVRTYLSVKRKENS